MVDGLHARCGGGLVVEWPEGVVVAERGVSDTCEVVWGEQR